MKSLVLTGCHRSMWAVHDLTVQSKRDWAAHHGYDFLDVRQWAEEPAVVWQKMRLIERMLINYDVVAWLDGDALVTNREVVLDQFEQPGIHISHDWGGCPREDYPFHFNTGNMVFRRTERFGSFFYLLYKAGLARWFTQWDFEQGAMRELSKSTPWIHDLIKVHPGPVLNAVPYCVQAASNNPWNPQAFLAHLTGIPNERRVEILKANVLEGRFWDLLLEEKP